MASVARPLDLPIDANSEVPFYIPATGPATRPRRTLKYGDTFIVLDSHGDIGASAGGTDGLFHADTRYLSRLELLLNGLQPLLLGSNLRDDNAWLTVDQTNPDFYRDDRIILEKDTVHVVRTIFLWRATAYQRLAIRNYGDRPLNLRLTIMFDADFADLFEVRGLHRERRGSTERSVIGRDRTLWTYHALDGKPRLTTLTFDPPPTELAVNSASYHLALLPGQTNPIFLAVTCDQPIEPRPVPFFRGLRAARGELRTATRNATTVETSNEIFNETLCRSMADLHMLMTDTPQGRCPYAGIPWYSTTFGRDSLITALQMLWFEPSVARGVLRRLAHFQAKDNDPFADAQPGKILHEMRCGEMATLREVPFGLYYGSVDATPLFVLLAGLYLERTGDEDTVRELWPAIEAALRWIDGPGDPDQDGFVEYLRAFLGGTIHIADRLPRMRAYQVFIWLTLIGNFCFYAYVDFFLPDKRPTLIEIIFFGELLSVISILASVVYYPLIYDYVRRNKMGTFSAGEQIVRRATVFVTANTVGLFVWAYASFFLPPAGPTRVVLREAAPRQALLAVLRTNSWSSPSSERTVASNEITATPWRADGITAESSRAWEIRLRDKVSEHLANERADLERERTKLSVSAAAAIENQTRLVAIAARMVEIDTSLSRGAAQLRDDVLKTLGRRVIDDGEQVIGASLREALLIEFSTPERPDRSEIETLLRTR